MSGMNEPTCGVDVAGHNFGKLTTFAQLRRRRRNLVANMSSVSMQRRIKQAGSMMQRNFDHLDPKLPSNLGMKRVPGEQERLPKWIPPKDRVKQFNITIGDRVLVTTGDKSMKNKIGTVDRMDRTRNLVWLKESPFRVCAVDQENVYFLRKADHVLK